MTSIFQQSLGSNFDRLHPSIQERFGFSSSDAIAHIGTGIMDEITRGSAITIPFLMIGASRNLLFPEQGNGIPFTVANYAYTDHFGRETITWHRTFDFPQRQRHFDATMIFSNQRRSLVDYLGSRQHVAANLNCWVDDEGGINFTSEDQRCYEGPLRFRLPKPLTGHATVREWWDEDADLFRIQVKVTNPILGPILSYRGSFTDQAIPITGPEDIPSAVRPLREEIRE